MIMNESPQPHRLDIFGVQIEHIQMQEITKYNHQVEKPTVQGLIF